MDALHARWKAVTDATQIALPHVKVAAAWIQAPAPVACPHGCHLALAAGCILSHMHRIASLLVQCDAGGRVTLLPEYQYAPAAEPRSRPVA